MKIEENLGEGLTEELTEKFAKVREHFPMLKKRINGHPFVYLDSAATAQKPQEVIDAIYNFYHDEYGTVHRAVYATATQANEAYQESRRKMQRFLHAANVEEIIFTRGTTESINLVAYSFCKAFVKKGDEIMITEMEHHSNIVPWQLVAEQFEAKLVVVPFLDNGELDMEAFQKMLSEKTKIVACAHISNTLGTINPIQEIIQKAHAFGAKVLIDGAQGAHHIPVDVVALDADFYVFSGHKAVGPTGIGVLYGKKELLEKMPPYQGGGDMIDTVTFAKTTYNTLPLKFEAGTPMIAEVIGLGAAIDFLMQVGMQKIQRWEHELLDFALPRILEIPGLNLLGLAKNRGAILTFSATGAHPLDIATLLDLQGIAVRSGHLCAQPVMRHYGITASCRASFAFYNTKEEISFFLDTLKKVLAQLR